MAINRKRSARHSSLLWVSLALVGVAGLAAVSVAAFLEIGNRLAMKREIAEKLVAPESAKFHDLKYSRTPQLLCGRVSSISRVGMRLPATPFFVLRFKDGDAENIAAIIAEFDLEDDGASTSLWPTTLREISWVDEASVRTGKSSPQCRGGKWTESFRAGVRARCESYAQALGKCEKDVASSLMSDCAAYYSYRPEC